MMIRSVVLVSTLAASLLLLSGCGSTPELLSSWNNNEIVVDGNGADWKSNTYYLNDQHVTVGLRNDERFLYVCLMSEESQFRRQLMGLGLTIWFEAEGAEGKLGIHYPVGLAGQGRPSQQTPPEGGEQEDRDQMMETGLQQLEILGPGKDDKEEFSTLQLIPSISAKVGIGQGNVVYELKVPLRKSSDAPYAIGGEKGTVKLSMESGNPGERRSAGEYERRDDGGGGSPGGEGGGFRGGGRRGGGMGRGGGGGRLQQGERPQQFKFEAKIRLANSPAGSGNN